MSQKSQSSARHALVSIDEEGFTDKRCRNCRIRLSIEEVQVFVGKVQSLDDIICLNCYAIIVDKRSKGRRRSLDKETVDVAVEAKPESRISRAEKVSRNSSVRSGRTEKEVADKGFHRKKTDITMFTNATFNGGVFLNAVPGQSI